MPVGIEANIVATDSQSVLRPNQEPKKNYGGWVNAYTSSNYWKSISDYERSKKKKTFEPIY